MVGYVVPATHTKEQAIAVYRAAEIDVEQVGFVEVDPSDIEVLNRRDVMRLFQLSYPPALKSQRRGGRVVVAALIRADGSVAESAVVGPSGLPALDTAALDVAHGMKFRPGVTEGCRLPVWLFMPLTFQID